MERGTVISPLALALLSLLTEGPQHPYRMQQLIRGRGKDDVINVRQRTSIYQTIERLLRDGLIAVQEVAREEKRPDRTIYTITADGREKVVAWMREALATPRREFPIFPAAIAHLPLLTPAEVLLSLEARQRALLAEIARIDAQHESARAFLPRLFLLEDELLRATTRAEADWVAALIDDLRSGAIGWDQAWLAQVAQRLDALVTERGGRMT